MNIPKGKDEETCPRITCVVLHNFVLIQPSSVSVMKCLWKVPMIKCLVTEKGQIRIRNESTGERAPQRE